LFYHPAVWWVSGVIRAERENCCDDIVVRVRGDARGYAATLASLETARSRPPQPLLAAVGGRLIHRVRRLTNPPQARAASAPLASAIVALATVAMALLLWHARPAAAAPPAQQPAPAAAPQAAAAPQQQKPVEHHLVEEIPTEPAPPPPLTGPYLKWMNEDVAYIITDAERAAFKRLQTDPEREHFIEQFWLRRDPTPGTPENEFKEEHYRRIAYANDHFASGIPGWKTDRGRIYIVYGPPDEIEDHAAAGASPHSQQWLYRYIEGVGRNVIVEFQANAAGEFRMTMDPRNVFASMEPGELYAIVEVQPDRTAMIRIPLGESGGLYVVYGQVMKDGALVETFQQESVMSDFRKGIALAPGKYQLIVATRNGRGEGKRGVVEFTVK
jgi:GWxTD domain-containing protein